MLVLLAGHRLKPCTIVEIPAYCSMEPGFEGLRRRPSELAADFRRVDRVTAIVARPVVDELHQRNVIATRTQLTQDATQRPHDLEVGAFGIAADVVCFAGYATLENDPNRRAVVPDKQPVSHIQSV